MNGLRNPSGGLPLARRMEFRRAKMAETTGQAAEVPATPAQRPMLMQYGSLVPPSAATSG